MSSVVTQPERWAAVGAQAAATHEMSPNDLGMGAGCYAATEAPNAVAAG